MNIEKLNICRAGLKVNRLHTIPHIQPYNNGFHSANATLIAMELCLSNNMIANACIVWMLLHDIAEGYTGDIPANVKVENPFLAIHLKEIEARWENLNIDLPNLTDKQRRICKAADLIELGFFCLDELTMGNKNVTIVLKNVIQYLRGYHNILGVSDCCRYIISTSVKLTGENIAI